MSAGRFTAMLDCSFRRSSSASGGVSPDVPDHPIQIPPTFFRMESIAVANPPLLRFVVQLEPSRINETGSRLETTTKRGDSGKHNTYAMGIYSVDKRPRLEVTTLRERSLLARSQGPGARPVAYRRSPRLLPASW